MNYLPIRTAKIRSGTCTSNFSTEKSQAACDGWSWRLVLTRLHLRDTSPGSLSSHRQRGKRRTALGCCLALAFPRRCLPRQQDSCQTPQVRWHPSALRGLRVLPRRKGLRVLCLLWSPEPSQLKHSALTWPAVDLAAAFDIPASFCFFFLFILPLPSVFWAGSTLLPKPETETRWLTLPAKHWPQ